MWLSKTAVAALLLSALSGALADKKIELQDIEEDNLKSEKGKTQESDPDDYKPRPTIVVTGGTGAGTGRTADHRPLDYLKGGFLRLYETPVQIQQQPRYVQQYAVTENQERTVAPETTVQKPEYASAGSAPTMLGYLSNVPMQILYIPQYYADDQPQANTQAGIQYVAPVGQANVGSYQVQESAPETQNNYIDMPTYLVPSGRGYAGSTPQYVPQISYVTYGPPQATGPSAAAATSGPVSPQTATAPVVYTTAEAVQSSYAMPLVAYHQPAAPPPLYRAYYPSQSHYETNSVNEAPQREPEPPKTYTVSTERPHTRPESPRYYTSPHLLKGERGQSSQITELPPPSPLIYESQPSHLAGIPKVLPYYRPSTKPVYSHISGNLIPGGYPKHGHPGFGYMPKKRPSSLLDSYVPSGVQVEYMKRGLSRDPLTTYEVLSGGAGRYPGPLHPQPRQLERGFLPNMMYHTAAGGVTYGHYKRATSATSASSAIPHKIHK